MFNQFISHFKDMQVWLLSLIVLMISLIAGVIQQPFRYGFLNSLGIITAVLFLIGTFRQAWLKGDFAALGFQRNSKYDLSYKDYRERILSERETKKNIPLYASIILIILCIILPHMI